MNRNALLVGLTLAVVGCSRSAPAPSAGAPPAAAPITTAKPEKRPVKRVVEQPGTVQAFEETVLYSKLAGYVRALAADPNKKDGAGHDTLVDIGSRVTAGQVLAELSLPELDEEFNQKEAFVRQAEAEVTQAKRALAASEAGVVSATAMVAEAKAGLSRAQALYDRWQSEINRVTKLVAEGVIDSQSRDEIQNQFKSAEAGRHETAAKVASAEAVVIKAVADKDKAAADVTAAEARLDVAKADARRVDALRGYTRIKAPFDGVVTRRGVNTGDFVSGEGKHGVFTVARLDPVRVVVRVPEADSGLVSVGQPVSVALQTRPAPLTGKVARTSWSLEPGSRTLRVEVDLPNTDGAVRPGMYVYARLTAELPAAWSVPAAAVGTANDEPVIYLAENGKAVRAAVQLGRGDGQFTQIRGYKKAGATGWTDVTGEETVAFPAAALSDGQNVDVKK